jgi:hypothetical protein
MKNLVRYAAAAAIAAGYAAGAYAQNVPSSDNADLWLFVSDPGQSSTFALDTGISVDSVEPGTFSTTAKAGTVGVSTAGFTVSSAALGSFINASTDPTKLTWAVEAGQYNGATDGSAGNATPGAVVGIASSAGAVSAVNNFVFSNLGNWMAGFQGDIANLPTPNGVNPWSAGVWGAGTGAVAGSTNTYGQGIDQSGVLVGGSDALYLVTGNGNALTNQTTSYNLGKVSLTEGVNDVATLTNVAPAPVPVPAAVWLFGSGLLGLMGVGRRRAA